MKRIGQGTAQKGGPMNEIRLEMQGENNDPDKENKNGR